MRLLRLKRTPANKPEDSAENHRLTLLQRAAGRTRRLKKQLLKEAMVLGAVLVVLGGAWWWSTSWQEGVNADHKQLEQQVSKLSQDLTQLEQRLALISRSQPVYEKMLKEHPEGDVPIDRPKAKDVIQALGEQYALSSLRLAIGPVKDLEDASVRNARLVGQACEVSLALDAVSDEHIVAFLHDMQEQLAGVFQMQQVSITRTMVPETQTLTALSTTGKVSLVHADIKLVWMGLRLKSANGGKP